MNVLVVVNDWRSIASPNLRRGYPIIGYDFDTMDYRSVSESDYPNNGQLFIIPELGEELFTGQLLWCQPQVSTTYSAASGNDECKFICRKGDISKVDDEVAELLQERQFDPLTRWIERRSQVLTRTVYVMDEQLSHVLGPYEVVGRSGDKWQLFSEYVSRMPVDSFFETVRVVPWTSPEGAYYHHYAAPRGIILDPDQARRLAEEAPNKIDSMPQERLPIWLASMTSGGLGADTVRALQASVDLASSVVPLEDTVLRQRLERAQELVRTAQQLYSFRLSLVDDFVKSPEGQQMLQAHLAATSSSYIQQYRETLESRARQELATLDEQKRKGKAELDALQAAVKEQQKQLDELGQLEGLVRDSIAQNIDELKNRVAQLTPIWLIMSRQLGASPQAEEATSRSDAVITVEPIAACPVSDYQQVLNERALVQYIQYEMRRRGRSVGYHALANLYVSLKSGYLTLLAGPPGVGKSSLARMFVELLGHASRLLPVFVQRGWSDDRPLMGYFNSLYGHYEPSSAGLVEHLLRAADDERRRLGGFYTVLFEELNLSPAEHYLARFLSAMENEDCNRIVDLYQDGCVPVNGGRYPQRIRLASNVRFLGTINIDYTTESLSPRLLDRATLIWMEPQEYPGEEVLEGLNQGELTQIGPLSFEQMRTQFIRNVGDDDLKKARADLEPIMTALSAKADELSAPIHISPRTVRAIAVYLANSEGLMERTHALDFEILQRVLPRLTGFGARFEKRLTALREVLSPYERSLKRLEEIIALGNEDREYSFFRL